MLNRLITLLVLAKLTAGVARWYESLVMRTAALQCSAQLLSSTEAALVSPDHSCCPHEESEINP